jgi:hypothetical protein
MTCRLVLAFSLALAAAACGAAPDPVVPSAGGAAAVLIGAAIADAARTPDYYASADSIANLEESAPGPNLTAPVLPASARDHAPPDAARFDLQAARSGLAKADLGACRAAGVPRGYVRATALYTPNGGVAAVTFDAPAHLSPEAGDCMRERIVASDVAPFDGAAVPVRATWYVP